MGETININSREWGKTFAINNKLNIAVIATEIGFKEFIKTIDLSNTNINFIHVSNNAEAIRGLELNGFILHNSAENKIYTPLIISLIKLRIHNGGKNYF